MPEDYTVKWKVDTPALLVIYLLSHHRPFEVSASGEITTFSYHDQVLVEKAITALGIKGERK